MTVIIYLVTFVEYLSPHLRQTSSLNKNETDYIQFFLNEIKPLLDYLTFKFSKKAWLPFMCALAYLPLGMFFQDQPSRQKKTKNL